MSPDPPSPPTVISCRHASVAYGRLEVLHDVCLDVQRGAFLPLVGPNGSGKTTLLRAILGLVRPRRGRILTPFAHSRPGYVPQENSIDRLYPVSTRQIVAMGLYPHLGWLRPLRQAHKRAVQEALEQFGLAQHARKTFGELSGGLRQKALLARAFVSGAEVFLMDEPTSELDEQSEKEVLRHLVRLSRQEGKTVLLAHHGLDCVAELAPVICLVEHGRVRVTATAEVLSSSKEAQAGPSPSSNPGASQHADRA
jgi:ABC-type Mn2+/Zn2+ transport system ATPase subunit